MTLPDERRRAIENTREFLRDLMNPKATPRVPSEIRKRAYWCAKHFPTEFDMTRDLYDSFGEKDENECGAV